MALAENHAELLLRESRLRVTRPRLAVLTALQERPHSRADTVLADVRRHTAVSTQAVYDVLNVLSEHGVVRRIQPRGSVARYELETGDNHHHMVCRQCGRVDDVACAVGEAPCLELPESPGFAAVDEAEITWWGTCPQCKTSPGEHDPQHHRSTATPADSEHDLTAHDLTRHDLTTKETPHD